MRADELVRDFGGHTELAASLDMEETFSERQEALCCSNTGISSETREQPLRIQSSFEAA